MSLCLMKSIGSNMNFADIAPDGPPDDQSPPQVTNTPVTSPQVTSPQVQSVRRKLFGEVDHEKTRIDLQKELLLCQQNDMQKYNFDFAREVPIEVPDARYEWSQDTRWSQFTGDQNILYKQQSSTKLCKPESSQIHGGKETHFAKTQSASCLPATSLSETSLSETGSNARSNATSAIISLDSQPPKSPKTTSGSQDMSHDVNQPESQVKWTKQSLVSGKNDF